MAIFTRENLLQALTLLHHDNLEVLRAVEGISTDTRTLPPGALFIALRGERFDGHDYLEQAIARGAAALVLDERNRGKLDTAGLPTFWVPDTLVALGELARYHRRRFKIPLIAIAGSVGKTTTKDITAHLLGQQWKVHKTPGNWNNRIGVPLVLLGLDSSHAAAVVEFGTNQFGEIEQLCSIAEPTHGIITAIAEEHLEFFGTLDGVEHEETALFRWLASADGIACINLDDQRLRRYVQQLPHVITFGRSAEAMLCATYRFEAATLFPIVTLDWRGRRVEARVAQPGYAVAQCAIAAAAAAASVGMDLEAIAEGLSTYRPTISHSYARMVVQRTADGLIILNDCYNANPASMQSALDTLAAYPAAGQRIALLGDMRELGAATEREHAAIVQYAMGKADTLIAIGQAMSAALVTVNGPLQRRMYVANTHHEAVLLVRAVAQPGDVLLVKGSRSLQLEHVIMQLMADS